MRIARAHEFGGPEKVVIDEIAAPEPEAGQIRIAVKAAAVNPVDWKLLSGKAPVLPPLPLVLGGDVAGIVDAVGDGVDTWSVGDRVFAHPGLTGGYTEGIVLDASFVAPMPKAASFIDAAAVPLVALTALQGFLADGRDLSGLHVLVHNAAGGVGNAAVQIAKAKGAKVTGTASAANADFVRSLGADNVVDFRETDVGSCPSDVDILMDLVGNSQETGMWSLIKSGGSVIRIAGGAKAPPEETVDGVRAYKVRVRPNGDQLAELSAMMDAGKLKSSIEQSFAFDQVEQALRASMGGHVRGKIVLVVAQ